MEEALRNYYLTQDGNCAEATLRFLNDVYHLGLREEDYTLVSGYGGGFGCGITCGALCAAIAALGRLAVEGRAHATEGFGKLCADYVDAFSTALGATDCAELKQEYFQDDGTRCMETVLLGASLFCEFCQAKEIFPREMQEN